MIIALSDLGVKPSSNHLPSNTYTMEKCGHPPPDTDHNWRLRYSWSDSASEDSRGSDAQVHSPKINQIPSLQCDYPHPTEHPSCSGPSKASSWRHKYSWSNVSDESITHSDSVSLSSLNGSDYLESPKSPENRNALVQHNPNPLDESVCSPNDNHNR